jgi:hypothetical protein
MTTISLIDTSVVKATFVTLKHAAKLTGVPLSILRRRFKNAPKLGNHYYAPVAEINAFIQNPVMSALGTSRAQKKAA